MQITGVVVQINYFLAGYSEPPTPDPPGPDSSTSPVETNPPNTNYRPAFSGQTRVPGRITSTRYRVNVVTASLTSSWGIISLPDGRLLVTEKTGRMRIVTASGNVSQPITGIPSVNASGQGGLPESSALNCTVIEGDAMNYTNVKNAITGHDIVYLNLAGNLEAMTKNIVRAMSETNVKRIIAISSIGIYETPLKPVLVPYRKLAHIIEASGLDYTILRPNWFTNANEVNYALTYKGEPEIGTAISRKSIAAFVATIIENPDLYKNQNLGVSKPD